MLICVEATPVAISHKLLASEFILRKTQVLNKPNIKGEEFMSNLEKYIDVFTRVFEVSKEQLAGLHYQDVPLWDSVGHMSLVAELEDVFDIMMDTDDIIDLSSYEKGIEILKQNYDIDF